MTDDPKPLDPGQIRFHQASPPPLPPGDYTLTVTQAMSGGRTDATTPFSEQYRAEAPFTIAGPRFYLKPSEVYSVYPPAGQFGQFNNALPHMVFTRRTLPWERTIDGTLPDNNNPIPWLALLLLSRNDSADNELPKMVARTVGALRNPEAAIQGPQKLSLEHGQTDADLCNTIDLPADLFAEIVPSFDDLPLLAHVRDVNTGGKETLSLKQDGWFTVVLGNRLPATSTVSEEGETNLVCLVSLEGLHALLPKVAAGKSTVTLAPGKIAVRLAVLASWTFTCHGDNVFKTRMQALDDKTLLSLPIAALTATDDASNTVRSALQLGYVGVNHTTRLGEQTVSWYRGPLVPLEMAPRSPYAAIPVADRVLRYDLDTGMFAAEYASAFELGRMMALQNRSFASAMYRYRNRVDQDIAAERHRADLAQMLGVPASMRGRQSDKVTTAGYAPFVGGATLEQAASSLFADWAQGSDDGSATQSATPANTASISFDPPPEVTRFLARAVLLYGAPFAYLVPDERTLPPESIRYFFLDPGWIATLIQGATTIGRIGADDTVLDTYLRLHALDWALTDAATVRGDNAGPASTEPKVSRADWPLTGFLLRSELVDGWQGVEMRAYDRAGAELPPLRIDRLAPDIMICIFNGKVMELTVKQPPEGLHFGLSPEHDAGKYKRLSLRKVSAASQGVEPGAQIPGSEATPIEAPMRIPGATSSRPTRVVQIAELATKFADELTKLGHPAANFTSAEFAVEMVESPGLADFVGANKT